MRSLELLIETPAENSDEQAIKHLIDCSPYALRWLNCDPIYYAELTEHLHQAWTPETMLEFLQGCSINNEDSLKKALRQLRQHVMLRVIARDLSGLGNLDEVMYSMSYLAEICIQESLKYISAWQGDLYGAPIGENGEVQELIVIGMGKLGGYELNVSSDIDLIFAYDEQGETNGAKVISNQDYFTKVSKQLISMIDDVTEDGFVFRVDMGLRPFGGEGTIVSCIDAMEQYYQNNGREWERYAWIKGRVLAGPYERIRKTLKPFVFRKYLDFGVFDSMRDLKVQIQRDVSRKDMHDNIKLGRGGIREIEFIAQVFQLIRGGQDKSFQIRPTLSVLSLLAEKGSLSAESVKELSEAYVFLRNLEHRLQYVEDQQTQELPKTPEAQARIANAMAFTDWDALLDVLNRHRACVQQHFDQVFSDPEAGEESHTEMQEVWLDVIDQAESVKRLQALGYQDAVEILRLLHSFLHGNKYQQLSPTNRERLDTLMPIVIEQSAKQINVDMTLKRLLDLFESICRRASYLALMTEYPGALTLLAKFASASPWLMQYLIKHPVLLDELLDTSNLYAAPDFVAMRQELERSLASRIGDMEGQMNVMRDFKHAAIFRFAAQDIAGKLPLEALSGYLSDLADLILEVSLSAIWPYIRGTHVDVPKFAVIGYGKLGGRELGYSSDLDIIFLYDDDTDGAGEIYAKYAQRINNWFNSLTPAGMLYETDLQLRPDGNSGLLVSSVGAFAEYQRNKAWIWEHQALTRARWVAGDAGIRPQFEQLREQVLKQERDVDKLKQEVLAMRKRMRDANKNNTQLFDLKHDAGGIIDIEFIVQFLVLKHTHVHTELSENRGNITLLRIMANLNLIDAELASNVGNAYRTMRGMQHASRLQGELNARISSIRVASCADSVRNLWAKVFERP